MTTRLTNLPPAAHLPEGAARTLAAELDRLIEQRRQLTTEHAADQPTSATAGPDAEAKRADQKRVADLVRAGKKVTDPTKHADELDATRKARTDQLAYLATAITAANNDLVQWIEYNRAAVEQWQADRLAEAHDQLAEALATIAPLRTIYDEAHAARSWLERVTGDNGIVSWIIPASAPLAREWSDGTKRRTVGTIAGFDTGYNNGIYQ